MAEHTYIPAETLCVHYDIEISFIDSLNQMGLIEIHRREEVICIHKDQVADLERIIRLHRDLNVNPEGIDVVLNLLHKEQALRRELTALRNRLRRFEND